MGMTNITIATGKEVVVADGQGNARTYVGAETVNVPAADALKFIAAGLATAT